ncbi:ABC transporter permease [Ornithinimicrobium pekingense]|uniref:Exporter of polyketide antibiotics n=1 Tax=Ornithinimicrobium pekingense TaxID=384677 RepID=A0ABQ2F451_9MICO|nr:exporter of polyketide antibiotics [Ornithinimicrobium pekingense]GGK59034.1 exporter of polyketide antibiotics [Ornithinimicrobium pekingense]
MSTTTAPGTRRSVRSTAPADPEVFAGTGRLVRLFLRLDQLRITVWGLAFLLLIAGSVVSLEATYPTQESLQARAALMDNPSAIMMTGPAFSLDNYTFGAMLASELSLWVFLPAAIMSVLLAVRHTRAEEEAGRLETLRALPVGRFAPPTAALVTVAVANLVVALAVVVALVGTGVEVASSVAFAVATALTGLVFGAVAAVTAQVTEHARAASGMALGAIAVAFLVRGVGDVIDNQGSWLSWLSPFAWAQQTRLFVDLRWWPLLVSAAAVLALLALAVTLARRRDLGAGLRVPRPGPSQAAAGLLSPAGLARRLTLGTFVAWAIGLFLFAMAFGSLATALDEMVEDMPMVQEWIDIDVEDLTRSFSAVMLAFLAIGPAALLVSAVLQLRGEEQAGRVEGVLATGSSRGSLLGGWLAVVTALTLGTLVLLGLGVGVGVLTATGETTWVGELTVASLAYVPATLLLGSVAVALLGLAPRWSGLAWVPVVWTAIVVFLGDLLDLPGWARDLSPFARTPMLPGADVELTPLLVMAGLTLLLTAVGFVGLRRRDIPA